MRNNECGFSGRGDRRHRFGESDKRRMKLLVFQCVFLAVFLLFAGCGPTHAGDVPGISGPGEGSAASVSSIPAGDASGPAVYSFPDLSADDNPPRPVFGLDPEEMLIPARYRSSGIEHIVSRARSVSRLKWTPKRDLLSFGGEYVFLKGTSVTGLPYGQPVYNGRFVLYDVSLAEFLEASEDETGPFYMESGCYETICPYYSTDCSTFLSYCWNLPKRMVCATLARWGDCVSTDRNDLQVGDALIRFAYDAHAVLITGVVENEWSRPVWVEITEQTPPVTKVTRYGEGEALSLEDLENAYFQNGFAIYRNTDYRDGIPE